MKRSLIAIGIITFAATFGSAQPAAKPTLESRWADLASPDEGKATRALLALAATPKETAAFMQEHLKPVKADPKRVGPLLKQLDSNNFVLRNQAMMDLEYLGKYIKSDLESALKNQPTVETKMRLQQLLDKLPKEQKAAAPAMPKLGAGKSISGVEHQWPDHDHRRWRSVRPVEDARPPPPPPGPPQQWVRAVRAVTILEHLATPEARTLLQALAAGEAEALPTTAAREALGRMKK